MTKVWQNVNGIYGFQAITCAICLFSGSSNISSEQHTDISDARITRELLDIKNILEFSFPTIIYYFFLWSMECFQCSIWEWIKVTTKKLELLEETQTIKIYKNVTMWNLRKQ